MNSLLLLATPELAGGRWAAPGWAILAGGGLVAAFAVAYLALSRWGRKRPQTPGSPGAPSARRADGGKR